MSKRVIAIVESPLQLINANEYIVKYDLAENADFYFVSSRNADNIKQIKNTYNALKLKGNIFETSVVDIDNSFITRIKFYIKIILAAKKMPTDYSLVLVGHIHSIYQNVLANRVKNAKCVYVDDGNASVALINQLKRNKIKSFSSFSKRLFPSLLGLNPNIKYGEQCLFYFTIYKDLIESNHPYICFEVNELNYLLSEFCKKERNQEYIYFIGTPFYWNDRQYENFENDIKKISNLYKGKKVFYFPHRYESEEQLNIIKDLGWEIIQYGLPIELSLMNLEYLPLEFGFFFSTAVENISKLIKNVSFRSFKIDNIEFLKNGNNILKLYSGYEKRSMITVVKI